MHKFCEKSLFYPSAVRFNFWSSSFFLQGTRSHFSSPKCLRQCKRAGVGRLRFPWVVGKWAIPAWTLQQLWAVSWPWVRSKLMCLVNSAALKQKDKEVIVSTMNTTRCTFSQLSRVLRVISFTVQSFFSAKQSNHRTTVLKENCGVTNVYCVWQHAHMINTGVKNKGMSLWRYNAPQWIRI